jgi:hypothetical protein
MCFPSSFPRQVNWTKHIDMSDYRNKNLTTDGTDKTDKYMDFEPKIRAVHGCFSLELSWVLA